MFLVKILRMISVTELRAGQTFLLNNHPCQVVEYKHAKLGRGPANIRIKFHDLKTGSVLEKNFISGAKVEPVELESKNLQYLYHDKDRFYFMDNQTFEQVFLTADALTQKAKFLKEGNQIKILFWQGEPLFLDLPIFMIFEVTQAAPGIKGDTVSSSFKPATLDNGLEIRVPLFVKIGDKIKVDIRTSEYLERVSEKQK